MYSLHKLSARKSLTWLRQSLLDLRRWHWKGVPLNLSARKRVISKEIVVNFKSFFIFSDIYKLFFSFVTSHVK